MSHPKYDWYWEHLHPISDEAHWKGYYAHEQWREWFQPFENTVYQFARKHEAIVMQFYHDEARFIVEFDPQGDLGVILLNMRSAKEVDVLRERYRTAVRIHRYYKRGALGSYAYVAGSPWRRKAVLAPVVPECLADAVCRFNEELV